MKTFFVTFGQNHPLRDGWIEVEAENIGLARILVFEIFGTKWSMLYNEEHFVEIVNKFPKGRVGYKVR